VSSDHEGSSQSIDAFYVDESRQVFHGSGTEYRSTCSAALIHPIIGDLGRHLELYSGSNQTAHTLTLTPEGINTKFKYFFTKMHPYFPFFPRRVSIENILAASPCCLGPSSPSLAISTKSQRIGSLQPFARNLVAQAPVWTLRRDLSSALHSLSMAL
jgi:hypothetical protein